MAEEAAYRIVEEDRGVLWSSPSSPKWVFPLARHVYDPQGVIEGARRALARPKGPAAPPPARDAAPLGPQQR